MKPRKIIAPKDIKVGNRIRDRLGHEGVVEENIGPDGMKRLQFNGITVMMNHHDPFWYEILEA